MRSSKNPHRPRGRSGFHTRDSHSKFKIQNSGFFHKIPSYETLPTHPASLEFSSKSLDFIGIIFQVTRLHWNSLQSHPDSLEFSVNALGFTGIVFQVTRLHWNSLPSHPASLEFSSKSSGFTGILCQRTRFHWYSLPTHSASVKNIFQASHRAIRPVRHQAPRRAIPSS